MSEAQWERYIGAYLPAIYGGYNDVNQAWVRLVQEVFGACIVQGPSPRLVWRDKSRGG